MVAPSFAATSVEPEAVELEAAELVEVGQQDWVRARGIRVDVKRHAKEPNWDLVRISVAEPLNDLRRRVSDELLRRESKDALVPIDGDPVPEEYAERVRKYYERLGSGK